MRHQYTDEEEIEEMEQDAREIVSSNVRALLKLRGWSQEEIERRSGVAQKTVSNIVRSGSTMTNKLASIAYAFGMEPWMLLVKNAWEIAQPKKLGGLLSSYMECSRDGQEHIENTAEREVEYQKSKKEGR